MFRNALGHSNSRFTTAPGTYPARDGVFASMRTISRLSPGKFTGLRYPHAGEGREGIGRGFED